MFNNVNNMRNLIRLWHYQPFGILYVFRLCLSQMLYSPTIPLGEFKAEMNSSVS
jgi:hypothetical protein